MFVITVGELDGVPRIVASLNPSVNEFLALIGVDLAGVDVFSYRPRELQQKRKVGTFIDIDVEAVERLRPDLIILYYPVQRHILETASRLAKAVVAVPTPTGVDHVAAIFKFFAKIFDRDEEGDRIAGIYRDLLRGAVIYQNVAAVINLGTYEMPCRNSWVAETLSRVGLVYIKTAPCIFKQFKEPPTLEGVEFVVYEARGKKPQEAAFLGERPHVITPNDTLAHYGPSHPIDLLGVAEAAARGARLVKEASSVLRPSLRDDWYKPYR
ncbi:MAG: ABC transporter substrate-binding protein [Pyrobaculum sp.]